MVKNTRRRSVVGGKKEGILKLSQKKFFQFRTVNRGIPEAKRSTGRKCESFVPIHKGEVKQSRQLAHRYSVIS